MTIFPLPLQEILGHWNAYIIFLIIGFGFGYALEIGGFGNSKKIAALFYFKDMTVYKVFFGAVITALVLVFFASGVGLLDYNLVYVNPTYMWPGIVGGLIMGVGFIVGGFCPGTSLVAAATAKIDGMFFLLGVFFGIFLFGETAQYIEKFWYSSYLGRYTMMDWLGLPAGVIVFGIVIMALFTFWGAEKLEQSIGKKDLSREPKWRYGAAAVIGVAALGVMAMGQPTNADKWSQMEATEGARLANREVQIHPGELLEKIHDDSLNVIMLDVRGEADYNLFHILDARHVAMDDLLATAPELLAEPANTVTVVMSNDETAATEAWKALRAESVPSVYILEGGVNNWIATFADEEFMAQAQIPDHKSDEIGYNFNTALGARYLWAEPNPHHYELEFTPKVELEVKRGPSGGGCG